MRYVIALVAAVFAGLVTGLFSARYVGSDHMQRAIPALVVAVGTAFAVLAVACFLIARHADRAGVEQMSRLLLWVVFALAAVPGLAWFVLWLSDADPQALFGLAAVVVGGLPVLVAWRKPRALPPTLGFCLLVPIAMLVLWQRLFLVLPISTAVTGGWLLALALLSYARRPRSKTVVPSN